MGRLPARLRSRRGHRQDGGLRRRRSTRGGGPRLAGSGRHVRRFDAADYYLFSIPMWNHQVPYILKQFIDVVNQAWCSRSTRSRATADCSPARRRRSSTPALCTERTREGVRRRPPDAVLRGLAAMDGDPRHQWHPLPAQPGHSRRGAGATRSSCGGSQARPGIRGCGRGLSAPGHQLGRWRLRLARRGRRHAPAGRWAARPLLDWGQPRRRATSSPIWFDASLCARAIVCG